MPENVQASRKADNIQECITNLEQLVSEIEGVDFTAVEFRGMMG
jgi:hypothetical protein